MAKRVIIHHAHHPDEKVYRLTHAQRDEATQYVEVENPNYDPSEAARLQLTSQRPPGNPPTTYISPPRNGSSNGNGSRTSDTEISEGHYTVPPPKRFNFQIPDFNPEIHSPTKTEERKVPVYSDHQDVVWADWDDQWKGLSDQEIAAKQRQIVKDVFAAREQEQLAAAERAKNIRQIGEVEVEL